MTRFYTTASVSATRAGPLFTPGVWGFATSAGDTTENRIDGRGQGQARGVLAWDVMTRIASILLFAAAAVGCSASDDGGDDIGPDATSVSASCQEATEHSDLEWIQDNVLSTTCATTGACHAGAASSALGLNLEAGNAEAEMLNKSSFRFPSFDLVSPGDPDSSYLLMILGGVDGPRQPGIGTMPLNSPPLCDEKIGAIRRWIESM